MEKKFKVKWEEYQIDARYYEKVITVDVTEDMPLSRIKKLIAEEIEDSSYMCDTQDYLDLNEETCKMKPLNITFVEPYDVPPIKPKPTLNIYHLFRDDADCNEVESFIIVAENDKEARKIAAESCDRYSKDSWLISSYSVIRNLGKYTNTYRDEPHVVSKNVLSR